ncbi:ATP-binding cassette domain-containing protein [Leucobacter luti]|uniref:ATP-binding cassette domain-containing protein n=1 Tax=Leucobacter luti TaxID=340320 RepID=UPI0018E4F2B5|nr:ATP-binding cassette domain-containing protein [Leucobacter luti]
MLSDITFTARAGDRIGIIGENGTGKSTLLRILAGDLAPSSGTVSVPESVGLLQQELPYADHDSIARVLDDAQAGAVSALAAVERLGSEFAAAPQDAGVADAYSTALEDAERLGAWAAGAHRGEVMTGLGLGGFPETRTIGALSGGQRRRLALAAVLLAAPHTLLLDEPSNHLDDGSAEYVERVLHDWPGIVFLASHDRTLLDAVTTRILDLDPLPVPARSLADATPAADEAASGLAAARAGTLGALTRNSTGMRTVGNVPRVNDLTDPQRRSESPHTDDPGSGFGIRLWGVGYSAARTERKAELARWRARYEAEQREVAALTHEVEVGSREVNRKHESKSESRITRKFYADKDAKVTARRARNARVRLEQLERDRVRRPPEPLRFAGFTGIAAPSTPAARTPTITPPDTAQATPTATAQATPTPTAQATPTTTAPVTGDVAAAQVRDTGVGVGGDLQSVLAAHRVALSGRLAPVSFALGSGGRLLLAGANGSGKSTLLAILAGELPAGNGRVTRTARVGYLPQEVTFARPERTAAQHYEDSVGIARAEARPLEATGLLARRDLARQVGHLSVGQRRRLALAALVADPPPVLILDEPTNHLSLTLVEELEAALAEYPGALLVASHDRWLRSRWTGDVLTISGA